MLLLGKGKTYAAGSLLRTKHSEIWRQMTRCPSVPPPSCLDSMTPDPVRRERCHSTNLSFPAGDPSAQAPAGFVYRSRIRPAIPTASRTSEATSLTSICLLLQRLLAQQGSSAFSRRSSLHGFVLPIRLYTSKREQGKAQITYFDQHSMQRGLVNDWATQDSFSTVHLGDGQSIKPLRPFTLKMSLDSNAVDVVSHTTNTSHSSELEPSVVGTHRSPGSDTLRARRILERAASRPAALLLYRIHDQDVGGTGQWATGWTVLRSCRRPAAVRAKR